MAKYPFRKSFASAFPLGTPGSSPALEATLASLFAGKVALWQIIARVIDQGSRLSAVRLAQSHAACALLGSLCGFDENDLYASWA